MALRTSEGTARFGSPLLELERGRLPGASQRVASMRARSDRCCVRRSRRGPWGTVASNGTAISMSRARPSTVRGSVRADRVSNRKVDRGVTASARSNRPGPCTHQGVRVFAVRQDQEPDRASLAEVGQGGLERPPGGPEAGFVAVETEHQIGQHAEQATEVLAGQRGPERCHRVRDAVLCERQDVHIALDHEQALGLVVTL